MHDVDFGNSSKSWVHGPTHLWMPSGSNQSRKEPRHQIIEYPSEDKGTGLDVLFKMPSTQEEPGKGFKIRVI